MGRLLVLLTCLAACCAAGAGSTGQSKQRAGSGAGWSSLKVDGLRGGAGSGAPTYGYRQRAPVLNDGVADFPLGENLHA